MKIYIFPLVKIIYIYINLVAFNSYESNFLRAHCKKNLDLHDPEAYWCDCNDGEIGYLPTIKIKFEKDFYSMKPEDIVLDQKSFAVNI